MESLSAFAPLIQEGALLQSTAATLGWDQETNLPSAAVPHRARQLAYLSGKIHGFTTSKEWRMALEAAEATDPTDETARADLRELRHQFDRATKLPQALVEEASEASSLGKAAWAQAREASDFAGFAPHLEKLLEIARRKAELWGYQDEPYDALLSEYERGTTTAEVASLFDSCRGDLVETAAAAVARSGDVPSDLLAGHYPIAQQQILNREIAESVGFDFSAGRIDTTTHPFCTTLGPQDVRLTTRYDEEEFTSSLFGVLHEAGHGLYEQGLPEERFGYPSGSAVSLGIHESQSRLWENHVGRSRPFWERWYPRAIELFPHLANVSLKDFLRTINRASYSPIRVEADEATYDLHILLRFSLERRLLKGSLLVKDIPETWNNEFEELFGFRPANDTNGCLQDIHWAMGGLGYFATYSLGNLNSAQLFQSAMSAPGVAPAFERADYQPLLTWMQKKVHTKGSTLLPQDLMVSATGSPTQSGPYLQHLKERFL